MKKLLICVALFALPAVCQTVAKPISHGGSTLKESFAKASLRVLRVIEGELGSFDIGADGEIDAPRLSQQACDDLDVDAQSTTERLASDTLQTLLKTRLMHNTGIASISAKIRLAMADTLVYDDEQAMHQLRIKELTAKSQRFS